MVGVALLGHHGTGTTLVGGAQIFLVSLFEYFPALFLLEEVTFRGMLDAHLYHPGESRPWISAIIVSALWGLWHIPIVSRTPVLTTAVYLVVVHCAIGVPLSFFWRQSGNLAVPAFSHALIDAARNMLLG